MRTAALVACLGLLFAAAVLADDPVEFHLKDGRVVVGEILEFSEGSYLVRAGASQVKIAERDLRTISPVSTPSAQEAAAAEETPSADRSAEAREALQAGLAALEAGKSADARASLQKARDLDPWSLTARLALAQACEGCNDTEAAERELRQVLGIDPAGSKAHAALLGLYERTGQREKRDAVLEEEFRRRYQGAEVDYRAARHYLGTGDLERARAHWTRYLAQRPDPRPAWDVEARMERDAEELASSGQRQAAIQKLYDLMQHNPLERDRAMSRVLALHEDSVTAFLGQHDVARAWEELSVMAGLVPSRSSAYERRGAAVCVEEAARCVKAGDTPKLRDLLACMAARLPAPEISGLLASALEGESVLGDDPEGKRTESLLALREFFADHPDPSYGAVRERVMATIGSLADREEAASRHDHVLRIAEAMQEGDTEHADAWKSRAARAHRSLGLAAMDAHDYPRALSHLRAAAQLLPDDATVAKAMEDAEFYSMRASLAESGDAAAKRETAEAYLDRAKDADHMDWTRKELERFRTLSQVDRVDGSRDREKYFPLRPGTRWRYESSDGRQDVWKVVSRTQEGEWTRVEIDTSSALSEQSTSSTMTVFLSANEAYREHDGKKEVWLRFPISTGLSWEDEADRVTYRRAYLSMHETVQTRMATFHDCLKVLYESVDNEGGTLASELYYAPYVGLVKVVTPGGRRMEIVEFQQAEAEQVPSDTGGK